ncbi:unnamed protein product, partial [Rotaria sp. Silwood1]
ANRCRQMWTNRRFAQQHHHHHPYQRRTIPTTNEQYSQQQSSSCLKILINHPSIGNTNNSCLFTYMVSKVLVMMD